MLRSSQACSLLPALALASALTAGGPVQVLEDAVAGAPAFDPTQWVLVANHTHSSTGKGKYRPRGLAKIRKLSQRFGFGVSIVTDHNTLAHWDDPQMGDAGGVLLARGEEWTSDDGHANLIGYRAAGPEDVLVPCDWAGDCESGQVDYPGMVDEVHARGGLVVINHPALKRHVWPEDDFGADAVEVNRNLTDVFGRAGRAWWHRRLREGARIAAMGGSDYHYWTPGSDPEVHGHGHGHAHPHSHVEGEDCVAGERVEAEAWPYPAFRDAPNLIRMSERSEQALLAAIRARHVMVRAHVSDPLVFLGADLDGDRDFEDARAGDELPAGAAGEAVSMQARVLGGAGDELRILASVEGPDGDRVEVVRSVDLESDDQAVAFQVTRGAPGKSFVRLEIGSRGAAVSNPIFF